MSYRERMEAKLTEALRPERLVIKDESRKHAGHADRIAALGPAGHAPVDDSGETHFRVEIVSAAFVGKSRVDRQRLIHEIVADELRERVHALSLRTLTPEEAAALK